MKTRVTALSGCLIRCPGTHNDCISLQSHRRHRCCQYKRILAYRSMSSSGVTRQIQHTSRNNLAAVAARAVPERQQELEAFLPEEVSIEDVQQRSGRDLDTNVWAHKPAWCQPWTILGTGAGFVGLVNTISGHSALWTGIASVPILVWWYVFLVAYPAEFKNYLVTKR